MIGQIPQMFYSAPALLLALVKKCHDESYEIPDEISQMLENRELLKDGNVPANVKNYVLNRINHTEEGGISMRL